VAGKTAERLALSIDDVAEELEPAEQAQRSSAKAAKADTRNPVCARQITTEQMRRFRLRE